MTAELSEAERQVLEHRRRGRLPHDTDDFRREAKQQAIRCSWLGDGNTPIVHSFSPSGIGADWTLESVLGRIDDAARVEWSTSEVLGALRHPLAVTDPEGFTLLFEVPRPEPAAPPPPAPLEAWQLAVALTEAANLLYEVWRADGDDAEMSARYGKRVADVVERWARHPSHLARQPEPADVCATFDDDPRDGRGHRIYEAVYEALAAEEKHADRPGVRASQLARHVLAIAQGTGYDRVVATLPADSHIGDVAMLLSELEDRDYLRVRGNADGRVEVWARG